MLATYFLMQRLKPGLNQQEQALLTNAYYERCVQHASFIAGIKVISMVQPSTCIMDGKMDMN